MIKTTMKCDKCQTIEDLPDRSMLGFTRAESDRLKKEWKTVKTKKGSKLLCLSCFESYIDKMDKAKKKEDDKYFV